MATVTKGSSSMPKAIAHLPMPAPSPMPFAQGHPRPVSKPERTQQARRPAQSASARGVPRAKMATVTKRAHACEGHNAPPHASARPNALSPAAPPRPACNPQRTQQARRPAQSASARGVPRAKMATVTKRAHACEGHNAPPHASARPNALSPAAPPRPACNPQRTQQARRPAQSASARGVP